MNLLKIQFTIMFEDHQIDFSPYGPLTHRWLPDDEKDAILLNVGHSDYELKIWFKRRGKTNNGNIRFVLDKFDVDEDVISRQAILEAGPMSGEILVKNINSDAYDAVINNKQNEDYSKFANEVFRFILPPLNNFLRTLRFKHGQYWINEIEKFDSRTHSLGSYCNGLRMKWSNDNGLSWNDFCPTSVMLIGTAYLGNKTSYIQDYLTKKDWEKIKSEVNIDFDSTLAKELCINAWKYFDQKEIKHAIIEGVTALEVSISETVNHGLQRLNTNINNIDDFKHSKLETKLTVVSSLNPLVTEKELNDSIDIYLLRNKIVHDGQQAPKRTEVQMKFKSMLNLISKLTMKKDFKFPSVNAGNAYMSDEQWDEVEK